MNYKESFNKHCNGCDTCVMENDPDINEQYNCYHESFYKHGFGDGYDTAINDFLKELFKMEMPHSWFAIQDIAEKLRRNNNDII